MTPSDCTKKYAEVLDIRMAYVEQGEGDPLVFLHGKPTSSYLWRNIIPHLSGQGRCIAPDLIGMGKSDHPNIPYRYDDHYRYVSGFINALDIGSNLTLVIHDWGSGLGFRWAHDHEDQVKAIAFMEAIVAPVPSWDAFPPDLQKVFRAFRTEGVGWDMIFGQNFFVERVLSGAVARRLTVAGRGHTAEPRR